MGNRRIRRRHRDHWHIALAVPQGFPFLERSLHGIAAYARTTGSRNFTRRPDSVGASIEWLKEWPGDGAFAFIVTREDAKLAQRLSFPVVNLASHLEDIGVPSVSVDHAGVGVMGAQHLIERGFKRFGFFGAGGFWYSQMRSESFKRTVEDAGGVCQILESAPGMAQRRWRDEQRQLERWLVGFEKPVGIMCSNDLRAGMLMESCRRLKIRVPEDVAVIGVDNDPVFAEFDDPPLTSISRNDYEVGRQAAELLQRLMNGEPRRHLHIFVPPQGVVARRSTDTVAMNDEIVASVVQYIRANIDKPFGVKELISELTLSRRSLEYHFREALRCSPHDYITNVRINRATQLLSEKPHMKVSAVSAACGFNTPRQFRQAFRRRQNMTPGRYRQAQLARKPV
jgi:LacI family transcriptional regulator